MALFTSLTLHGLMLMSLPAYRYGGIFVQPVRVPLSITLEKLAAREVVAPVVVRDKKEFPQEKLEAAKPVADPDRQPTEQSLSRPGVSVSDVFFLRPISSRVNSKLLASGEYYRIVDVTEVPRPRAMKVPDYPLIASKEKISGWVLVMLFVDERGEVNDTVAVEFSESFFGLADQVAAGLVGSTYTPGRLDGRAVKTLMFATVRFEAPKLSESQVATATHVPLIFGYKANGQGNN
jgi:hypothetical protein